MCTDIEVYVYMYIYILKNPSHMWYRFTYVYMHTCCMPSIHYGQLLAGGVVSEPKAILLHFYK